MSGDKSFEEQLNECRSSQEVADLCIAHGELTGAITRGFDGVARWTPREAAVSVAQPPQASEGDRLLRRIVTDHGETRLLTAYSVSGLDVLEKAFRNER